jgi:hypothetical protein
MTRNFQSAAAGAAAKLDETLNIGEGLNGASRALASVSQCSGRKSGHHE